MKRYECLKRCVTDRKEGFNQLIDFLEEKTDWLNSPASTKYHLNRQGGLLEHSCNVAETLLKLKAMLAPDISEESCVICGLFHDLGKAGMPGNPQYLINEKSLKQQTNEYFVQHPYVFNKSLTYLSVPVRSLYLILPYLKLEEDEVQAIMYHDGQYVDANKDVAAKEEKLTLLLQYADNWSGFVIEK